MKKPTKPKVKSTKLLRDEFAPLVLHFPEIKASQDSRQNSVAKPENFVATITAAIRQFATSFRRSPREA